MIDGDTGETDECDCADIGDGFPAGIAIEPGTLRYWSSADSGLKRRAAIGLFIQLMIEVAGLT